MNSIEEMHSEDGHRKKAPDTGRFLKCRNTVKRLLRLVGEFFECVGEKLFGDCGRIKEALKLRSGKTLAPEQYNGC